MPPQTLRHPGLEPGSIPPRIHRNPHQNGRECRPVRPLFDDLEWIPDQVRDDEGSDAVQMY
jgi:hypothetical protein